MPRVPWRYGLARGLWRDYGLRSLLLHHIADQETSFTAGLGVTTTTDDFHALVDHIVANYRPVSLDDVVAGRDLHDGRPPLLLTFDDAYRSVATVAAPLLADSGVPAVFFVNGSAVDGNQIPLDNLVAHIVHERGMATIDKAFGTEFDSLEAVINEGVVGLGPDERDDLRLRLCDELQTTPSALARSANLFVTSDELRELPASGVEIGCHTWSHVFCRHLDAESAPQQMADNAEWLSRQTEQVVRSFAFPYGRRADRTGAAKAALVDYQAAFLVEGRANPRRPDLLDLTRVSPRGFTDGRLFTELEVLPRLRTLRDRVRTTAGRS